MKVQLLVSKHDFALRKLLKQCMENNIEYDITYMEDNPELVEHYQVESSPNVVINGQLSNDLFENESFVADFHDQIK